MVRLDRTICLKHNVKSDAGETDGPVGPDHDEERGPNASLSSLRRQ
jgi:hypothetical protein